MEEKNRGAIAGGLVLIGLGIAFVLVQYFGLGGGVILTGLGGAFLVAWAVTRTYGLLVPGCILTGLGAGLFASDAGIASGVLFGLGAGFLAIPVLDALWTRDLPFTKGGWWPLVPGGVLLLVAVGVGIPRFWELARYVWPLALIGGGAWIIWSAVRGGRSAS